MKKQTAQFITVSEDGAVKNISRSTVLTPKINYSGKGTKWFDDTKLLKKGGADNGR